MGHSVEEGMKQECHHWLNSQQWHSTFITHAWTIDWVTRSHDREYNVSMNSYT